MYITIYTYIYIHIYIYVYITSTGWAPSCLSRHTPLLSFRTDYASSVRLRYFFIFVLAAVEVKFFVISFSLWPTSTG